MVQEPRAGGRAGAAALPAAVAAGVTGAFFYSMRQVRRARNGAHSQDHRR